MITLCKFWQWTNWHWSPLNNQCSITRLINKMTLYLERICPEIPGNAFSFQLTAIKMLNINQMKKKNKRQTVAGSSPRDSHKNVMPHL